VASAPPQVGPLHRTSWVFLFHGSWLLTEWAIWEEQLQSRAVFYDLFFLVVHCQFCFFLLIRNERSSHHSKIGELGSNFRRECQRVCDHISKSHTFTNIAGSALRLLLKPLCNVNLNYLYKSFCLCYISRALKILRPSERHRYSASILKQLCTIDFMCLIINTQQSE
jgi:hypothetical protein